MKPYTLERRQILPVSLEDAWSFFSNPANLVKITPPDMDFRITSPPCEETYAGQIITYSVRPLMRVAVNWTTEITHVERPNFFVDEQRFGPYRFWHHPNFFVDEQRFGPYRFWHHQHRFSEVEGGVEMHDLVHYLLHHDHLVGLINRLIVAPRLRRIFDYRGRKLQELFPVR